MSTVDFPALPPASQARRWQRYLADERAERAVYESLAARRTGEERSILLELAAAEERHEAHWIALLGPAAKKSRRPSLHIRLLGALAHHFGSVFVLALTQRAESRSPYTAEVDATPRMAADEAIHAEVVRALATRARNRLSGTFRAAVFGANDGLVSNLALLMGLAGAGVSSHTVLLTGVAGLLAGALSMGAGEYVSVKSQRELIEASRPAPMELGARAALDLEENEVALIYRARGLDPGRAQELAGIYLSGQEPGPVAGTGQVAREETIGTAWSAAMSSFLFFSSGAVIPLVPFLLGLHGIMSGITAALLVGLALLLTGCLTGLLSGTSLWRRAVRQLLIGFGAAAATYLLGHILGGAII